jgi:hypothetical protein
MKDACHWVVVIGWWNCNLIICGWTNLDVEDGWNSVEMVGDW